MLQHNCHQCLQCLTGCQWMISWLVIRYARCPPADTKFSNKGKVDEVNFTNCLEWECLCLCSNARKVRAVMKVACWEREREREKEREREICYMGPSASENAQELDNTRIETVSPSPSRATSPWWNFTFPVTGGWCYNFIPEVNLMQVKFCYSYKYWSFLIAEVECNPSTSSNLLYQCVYTWIPMWGLLFSLHIFGAACINLYKCYKCVFVCVC